MPPGQFVTEDFPVLTAGPNQGLRREEWRLTVGDGVESKTYDWDALVALGTVDVTTDIHCVTHWTKLDTTWTGVPVSTVFEDAGLDDFAYADVRSYGGYSTNVPVEDLIDRDAMFATAYEGEAISDSHGGPVRLLIPHLYLWKSAKWVREVLLDDLDSPGFWEQAGYHNYGDPFREQRYYSD
ncbi:molybdopterin-dependent oxidoreductase [Ruania alba]|uniref:molybdopterin-dependent oxidoreductase n=1 Tax=Ruania alba TaxID=648782 RepID=UPI000ADF0F3B|nr:molybdopterin-dependent oxidoreductase [Ruania alba]